MAPNATAAKGDSFSICVLGQDPFGPSLDSMLAGETLDGKPLAAKRISTPETLGNAASCSSVRQKKII